MSTVRETRHANLLLLIQKFGTLQALADKLEKSHAQISQLRNQIVHSASGKPRTIGDYLARDIEKKLGMPRGWMDVPSGLHSDPPRAAGEFSERAASLASRLDALSGDRQARAFALLDLTLRTLEAEEVKSSESTSRRSRNA